MDCFDLFKLVLGVVQSALYFLKPLEGRCGGFDGDDFAMGCEIFDGTIIPNTVILSNKCFILSHQILQFFHRKQLRSRSYYDIIE